MHQTVKQPRAALGMVAALLALAATGLAACGGSSHTSSTASAGTPAAATASGGRFAALRECLQKHGVTLPQNKPGTSRPGGGAGGGFFLGGGPQLPPGVSQSQFEAAIKACGGSGRRGLGRGAGRLNSPAFQQQLAKFSACMRENGVNLPPPNTSGKGSIFNTGGLNTASAKFTAATAKCRPLLRPQGAPQPGGPGGPGG
jgi:hypothetical protein